MMELLNSMSSVLAASTVAALGTAYVNAKFGISNDLRNLHYERTFAKRLQQRIAALSPLTTYYGLLQHAVDVAHWGDVDALWFEQKTWTYAELKSCMPVPQSWLLT
jgi:hypothetical protein